MDSTSPYLPSIFCLSLTRIISPNIGNLSGPSIQALPGSSVDWNYKSQPLKFASNQTIAMTRGKVLGYVYHTEISEKR